MNNKPLVAPKFETIFLNDPQNYYIVGITEQSISYEREIEALLERKDLDKKINLNEDVLTLETETAFYSFDLKDHLKLFLSTLAEQEFFIAFMFLDENMQPKNTELKAISFDVNVEQSQ